MEINYSDMADCAFAEMEQMEQMDQIEELARIAKELKIKEGSEDGWVPANPNPYGITEFNTITGKTR